MKRKLSWNEKKISIISENSPKMAENNETAINGNGIEIVKENQWLYAAWRIHRRREISAVKISAVENWRNTYNENWNSCESYNESLKRKLERRSRNEKAKKIHQLSYEKHMVAWRKQYQQLAKHGSCGGGSCGGGGGCLASQHGGMWRQQTLTALAGGSEKYQCQRNQRSVSASASAMAIENIYPAASA